MDRLKIMYYKATVIKTVWNWPWLVWLGRLSASLQTKGLLVPFLIKAHAWVVGQTASTEHKRGKPTLMFLSLSFSLPSPLSKNK